MASKLLTIAVLLCLLPACGGGEPLGQEAPPFSGRTLDGAKFSNESLKGKVVLIQFWATWCGFCRKDQPAVEDLVKRYGSKLTVLAVSVNETKSVIREYLAQSPRSVTVVATEDTNLPRIFQPRGFPTYLALNKDGNIVGVREGLAGLEGLQTLIKRAGLE